MTSELDLLGGYMNTAKQPTPADLERSRQRLEAVIDRENEEAVTAGDHPELIGVAHLVLRVSNWRRSARWYQDILGFERRQGDRFAGFSHPGAGFVLLFRPTDEAQVASAAPTQRLEHIALHVPSITALEGWQEELSRKGVEVAIDHMSIGSSITLHDPDGLEIELFAPSAGGVLDPWTSASALSASAAEG
jgi:catechol 2,3-dioxygenase-like lactoylglutathione lyase family enzyme